MKRQLALGALGLLLAVPATLPAQEGMAWSSSRGRIGVMVQLGTDAEKEKRGALVASVVPDGPADKAGIRADDIITKFNGTSLAAKSDDDSPGRRLVELAQKLKPGDKVDVEYLHGGKSAKATLEADEGGRMFAFTTPGGRGEYRFDTGPMMERMAPLLERMPSQPGQFRFMFSEGGLRLEDLNKDLGEYFGTSRGVLVLETPRDSASQLRAGDVILSIDGRTPNDAAHAHRILGSYEQGESAKLEIMRKQKKMTVTWTAPGVGGMLRKMPAPERTKLRVPARPMRRLERT